MVAFIIPITVFILHFTLTYGLAEYSKSTVITAAREAARTYAVSHNQSDAVASAVHIIQGTLSASPEYFNPSRDVAVFDEGKFAVAVVTYRVPVAAPEMMKLIGVNRMSGRYMPVTSSAKFIKEAVPGA